MKNHQLITTLINLRGNTRACVYTESLWNIPYNLFIPYASIYMLTLGLTDSQIGSVTSIGLIFQVFWSIMSGAITDKLGRKRTTLIFDTLSWSVPCLIWAMSQNFMYFLVAAIVNSALRVPMISWQCLLVEDTEPHLLVDIYSWVHITGLLAAFVSPIAGLLIGKFTLVPTMRGIYWLAFIMMTSKFLILNVLATETQQGRVRMRETKDQSLLTIVHGSLGVFKDVLQTPATLFTAGLMVSLHVCLMIHNTFWPILVTEKLQIPPQHLALYHVTRSMTMFVFFFAVMPRLRTIEVRKPLLMGFFGLIATQILLISAPTKNYVWLFVVTVLEGCSIPVANTLIEKLLVTTVDPQERARIMAILYVIVLLCTSPFGWIAGQLSEINRGLPFVLNIILFGLGSVLTFLAR